MFQDDQSRPSRGSQWAIGGLAILSLTALIVTAWILTDFSREQEILEQLTQHLPASDLPDANELAGELRLQSRLSALLILNIVASAVALTMLVRAYISSEHSLREVKVLATDILASMDQGVITTDQDGAILSVNPYGRQLLNLDESDSQHESDLALEDLRHDHRTLLEICRHVLEHHDHVRDQDYVAEYNGHARTLRAGCSLLRDHHQRHLGTVIHVRDVTEKTLLEQRLRRMERYTGLGSLAAGLHHEIKNPLAALSLHVQLLEEQLEEDNISLDVRQMLTVIKTEVTRIGNVLEGFRDFASIGRLDLAPVNLADLIQRQVELVAPRATLQNVNIVVHTVDEAGLEVQADRVRLEQVLLNLLVNAMEAMPEGGTITISPAVTGSLAEIQVADTGCGIPEDLKDKIFDPYFTTKGEGTGLGLALCDKIMRQHHGSLEYRSSSAGARFLLSLPTSPNAAPQSSEKWTKNFTS